MGVRDHDVIDGIGIERSDGVVVLFMREARPWDSKPAMLAEFEAKANCYLRFILGGQLAEMPQFAGRATRIELYCQYAPPMDVMHVLRLVRDRLKQKDIGFATFFGADRSCPMDLDIVDRGGGLDFR